jgi:hypothetical protein
MKCNIKHKDNFGYFPAYSYYYVPFPLFGTVYPHSLISNRNMCDNCLTKITTQDEQQVLNSITLVPQSDLLSEHPQHRHQNLEIPARNLPLALHPPLNRFLHEVGAVLMVAKSRNDFSKRDDRLEGYPIMS